MREFREYKTEVRAVGSGSDKRIEGYAAVFNISAQLPEFREQVKPGAFTRAVQEKHDVVCLFNHDSNIILGRTTSGTLRVSQDSRGLHYDCLMPNTETARSIHESIRRGDITGCSFAFTIPDGGQAWSQQRSADGNYFIQRDISDVNLLDVSPVTHPCYGGTEVSARMAAMASVPVELRSVVDALNYANRIAPPLSLVQRNRQAVAGLTQEEIDALVDNRDLERYPLSGYEKLCIARRNQLFHEILD